MSASVSMPRSPGWNESLLSFIPSWISSPGKGWLLISIPYPSVMGSDSSLVGPGTHCSEHLHFTGQTGSYLGHLDLSTFLSLTQGTRDLDLDKVQICVSVCVLASQERQGPKLIPEFFSSSARPKLIFQVTYN